MFWTGKRVGLGTSLPALHSSGNGIQDPGLPLQTFSRFRTYNFVYQILWTFIFLPCIPLWILWIMSTSIYIVTYCVSVCTVGQILLFFKSANLGSLRESDWWVESHLFFWLRSGLPADICTVPLTLRQQSQVDNKYEQQQVKFICCK